MSRTGQKLAAEALVGRQAATAMPINNLREFHQCPIYDGRLIQGLILRRKYKTSLNKSLNKDFGSSKERAEGQAEGTVG